MLDAGDNSAPKQCRTVDGDGDEVRISGLRSLDKGENKRGRSRRKSKKEVLGGHSKEEGAGDTQNSFLDAFITANK